MTQFPEQNIVASDEFKKLEELGFVSDYIHMRKHDTDTNKRYMDPLITAQGAIEMGFFPKGTKVRWIDQHGYPYQRDIAREKIGTDRILTVRLCNIGRSSSTYKFEEVEGQWNSVMFEKVDG